MFDLKKKGSIAQRRSRCGPHFAEDKGETALGESIGHYGWNQTRGGNYRRYYKTDTWPIILSETDSSSELVQLGTKTTYVAVLKIMMSRGLLYNWFLPANVFFT
jgi:hypothetical protein